MTVSLKPVYDRTIVQKGERTRRTILDAAAALATQEGLETLSIGRLAGATGMSKSGLFAHFGSKEELQLATVDAATAIFYERVARPALEQPEGAPRLRAFCERYVDYLEGRVFSGGCFFAAATAEFDSRPGPVRDKLRDGQCALRTELVRQARIAGVADPEQLVFEIISIIQGANAVHQLLDDKTVFERARRAIDARLGELLERGQ